MDGKGRIVIPKSIRERLELSVEATLAVEVDSNRIVLRVKDVLVAGNPSSSENKDGRNALKEFLVDEFKE